MKPKPFSTRSVRIIPVICPSPIVSCLLYGVADGDFFVLVEQGRDRFLARLEPPRRYRNGHLVALAKHRRQPDHRELVRDRIFVQSVSHASRALLPSRP